MMHKFYATLLIFAATALLFVNEDVAAQVSGVFVDGFGENTKSLNSDEAIITWLDYELKEQLNLGPEDQLNLSVQSTTVNNFNVRSLHQTHQGIPVVGYESRLVLDAQGNQIALLGQHQGFTGDAPTEAAISSEQAVATAGFTENSFISDSPVYKVIDGELRLSWQVEGQSFDGSSANAERLYLDAISGEVIARYPLEYNALSREVGDMQKACRAMGVTFPLSQEDAWPIELMVEDEEYHRSEGEPSEGARHVDDLYNLLGDAYAFMESVLGMDSVDNNGMRLKGIAGVRFMPGSGWNECVGDAFNAFWSSQWNELYMPEAAMPFIEIVSHELTHGIISSGSGLEYEYESGALNEAIADAIGVSFRAWKEAGGGLGSSPSTIPTFTNLWLLRGPDGPLRSMSNPGSVDNNPDHYDIFYSVPIENDQGGVHSNSSIINQAFYILVEGGRHPRLGTGPDVQGIGIANASKIFALAASQLLTPYADFEAGRNAFALAAEILFGKFSDNWIAVHEAMDAVGISGTWQREAPRPPPVITPTPIPQQSPQPSPTPAPETSLPAPGSVPDTVSDSPAPAPSAPPASTAEATNNNALYIGLGLAFVVLALFGLSRLRPEYSTTVPEFKRSAASPVNEPKAAVVPQQIAVSRSGGSAGRLVGTGTNTAIVLDDTLLTSREGLVIGRSALLNHVVLDDSRISRRHLRFHKEGQAVLVEDLNSTHGTLVNGRRLQPFTRTKIQQGDSIEIAGIRFTCDLNA